METTETRKEHWEKIYNIKQPSEVSWYQQIPATSLQFFNELNLPKSAAIFDNGAGDSHFVDNLLKLGYENITIQDISSAALNRVKLRLGDKTSKVRYIIDDEAHCSPQSQYDVWHDRAAFHFLTEEAEIQNYIHTIEQCIKSGGYFIIATFSDKGPKKCSGLPVHQYSEHQMEERLSFSFEKVKCITEDHHTPFNTTQNFLYCVFRKK